MTPEARRRWTGEAVMSVTILLMGSSYPFAKEVLATMSPLLYSGSRYVIAGLFLLAVMALMRKPFKGPARQPSSLKRSTTPWPSWWRAAICLFPATLR